MQDKIEAGGGMLYPCVPPLFLGFLSWDFSGTVFVIFQDFEIFRDFSAFIEIFQDFEIFREMRIYEESRGDIWGRGPPQGDPKIVLSYTQFFQYF